MSSVQHLREFICARLTAAAEEIFTEVEKTIEEEIDCRRKLLDISWKPQITLHTAEDLPLQHDYKEEEEVLADQLLFKQELDSSLDQEEPESPQIEKDQEEHEPPQVEEDQEEVHIGLEGQQLVLKEESEEMYAESQNLSGEETDPRPQLDVNRKGKFSLSKAEQLLVAIADGSDVEDLSDGEENDGDMPRVDERQLGHSEDDYLPEDDSNQADLHVADNESEPQHEHRRKRQRVGDDDPDEEELGRGGCLTSAPLTPDGERTDWQPLDYVEQYIDSELLTLLADCTNSESLAKTGTSLHTSLQEMYHFFGAAILMSCANRPQTRMFWSGALGVPAISAISATMPRDRFFKLRSRLKVVIDDHVPEDEKNTDKFWKVRPFMNRVLRGCHLQTRPQYVAMDEQMIPFTGACPYRQYLPLKANPVGMKNFVLASTDGIVLDFEVYQGEKTLALQIQDSEGLSLGALVIKRLAETLHPGTKVFCRFFDQMQEDLTGTTMQNRVPEGKHKRPQPGGGASATASEAEGTGSVIKLFDNKPVEILPVNHEDVRQPWCKTPKDLSGRRERGADLSDRMMSFYRMRVRTKKWTVRMMMHLTDLALLNSWLLYRRDNQENGTPRKAIMKFPEFRMVIAQVFLNKCEILEGNAYGAHLSQPGRRSRITPVPHVSVRTCSAAHLPEMVALRNSMRCRVHGCSSKSRVRCTTCNVFLCLRRERNCFAAFHTGQ